MRVHTFTYVDIHTRTRTFTYVHDMERSGTNTRTHMKDQTGCARARAEDPSMKRYTSPCRRCASRAASASRVNSSPLAQRSRSRAHDGTGRSVHRTAFLRAPSRKPKNENHMAEIKVTGELEYLQSGSRKSHPLRPLKPRTAASARYPRS